MGKTREKAAPVANDANYDAIVPLAAKYLKARSNEDRQEIISEIEPLATKVNVDALAKKLSEAIANKDVLAGLLTLKYVGIVTEEQKGFLGKALEMKNGAVKLEAINLSIANAELLADNKAKLETILSEEKSPFIKEIIEKALA